MKLMNKGDIKTLAVGSKQLRTERRIMKRRYSKVSRRINNHEVSRRCGEAINE